MFEDIVSCLVQTHIEYLISQHSLLSIVSLLKYNYSVFISGQYEWVFNNIVTSHLLVLFL